MRSTLITGIGELVTNDRTLGDGSALGILREAALVIEDGRIAWAGAATAAPAADERVDAGGRAVVPGFVDSHTHLVFAGERSAEFAARMAGEPYTGGGIMTTVAATRAATCEELRANTRRLADEMLSLGTTTVEIKSGYGLTVADEVKLLEVACEFTDETTFLGAHVVPAEFAHDRAAYVALVCGEMLDACAPLARWIDVFCDTGAFDEEETRAVLAAGVSASLLPRLHGNQLEHGPGVQLAAEFGAASVDHCTHLTDDDIGALRDSGVVATLLPGADFSTRGPYPDARALLEADVTVALATDCNPGSSYVTSMPFCIALAVREMRMTPAEALY
ncbi:MAG: imidazolonepropionase, partial [Coriobacteriia bacterium]|nr:imidazolonepropionase [Coriobacteriia bacterium]